MRLVGIGAAGRPAIAVPGEDAFIREVCAGMRRVYGGGYAPPWIGYLAVVDDTVVGSCAFKSPPREGQVEIAYFTFAPFERRGHATRMAAALLAIAAATDPRLAVTARTRPEENASTRILRRHGFACTGSVQDPDDGEVWQWRRPPPA